MDAYRRGDEFVVSFDLPGIAPGKIDLTIEQNVLTIKAQRRFDSQEGDEVIAAERPHGAFTRQLFLGNTVDAEHLVASYETGVLILGIPVAESAKPRKVDRRHRRANDRGPDHPGRHVAIKPHRAG
jgi:HSP20 family protein